MRNEIITLIGDIARDREDLVFLTGDLGFSVVEPLQKQLGNRFINAGVAEANMISMASTISACGFTTFAYSIAPFVTMRCFEQIRNDVCYHKRKVHLIGVGAGYMYGSLGPSHHALEDTNLLAALPNMAVLSPGSVEELHRVYALALSGQTATYTRIGRDKGPDCHVPKFSWEDAAYILRDGSQLTLVASGTTLGLALNTAQVLADEGISARVLSVPVLSPFPATRIADLLNHGPVISLFEGTPGNPLETGVMRVLTSCNRMRAFVSINAGLRFADSVGSTEHLRAASGLTVEATIAAARRLLHQT